MSDWACDCVCMVIATHDKPLPEHRTLNQTTWEPMDWLRFLDNIITESVPNPTAAKGTATPWCWHLSPTNATRSATTSRFERRSQGFRSVHTICPQSGQPLQSCKTLSWQITCWFINPGHFTELLQGSSRPRFGLIQEISKEIEKTPKNSQSTSYGDIMDPTLHALALALPL